METTPGELVVQFNPMPAAERVAHYQAMIRSRLGWLVVGLIVVFAFWFWQRDTLDTLGTVLLFVIGMGFSTAWVVIAGVMWTLSKRSLAAVGQGVAMRIGPSGIAIGEVLTPWHQVAAISAQRGSLGAGQQLVVDDIAGGSRAVPLTYLDALPSTLDGAIRMYSGGRRWLDASALEE